jgi:hypothetical protein
MTLRMHPVSPSRWKQLAASRHPIDLTAVETPRVRVDDGRRQAEYAALQAEIDTIATRRVPTNR